MASPSFAPAPLRQKCLSLAEIDAVVSAKMVVHEARLILRNRRLIRAQVLESLRGIT